MNRLSFFFQQLVGQADLNTLEDDVENAEHNIVADILGFGLLIGGTNPATVVQNTVPDLNVKANRLLGYEQAGRRLSNLLSGYQGNVNKGAPPPQLVDMSVDEVAVPTTVAGVGNEKTLSIFLSFVRNPSTPRTDGNNATVYYNQDESVQFNVVQSAEAGVGLSVPPPLRANQVLLADVKLIHLQTAILNADVSQSRRQAFALLLPHGASHASTGSDPVPNANGGAGGLMSAADFTKLASITSPFAAWIGGLLNFEYAQHFPATITAPSANNLDVTSRLNSLAAGGSPSKEGVVTQSLASDSIVELWDPNNNEIKSAVGNRIYGKIVVDNETTPTAWTLNFFTKIVGVETAYDFTGTALAGATLTWAVTRSFRLDHLPSNAKATWLRARNQAVAIPSVKVSRNGGGATNAEPTVNVIEGSNITIAVADNPGSNRVDVTITATASGGFPGFGSSTAPDTPGGSGGGSGLAADAGHQHTLSSQYALEVGGANGGSGTTFGTSIHHPRIAVGMGNDGTASPVGIAFDPGPVQASTQGSGATYTSGKFLNTSGGSAQFTAWNNGTQTLTATHSFTLTYFVLGATGL